jgi:hypothetical protein
VGSGEVIGGVALAALAVVLALSWVDEDDAAVQTSDGTVFVWNPSSTTAASSTTSSTTTTTVPATQPPADTATAVTSTAAPADSAESMPPTTPLGTDPVPVLLTPDERATVAVQVLNGGAPAGTAAGTSEVLTRAGFAPLQPRDADETVDPPGRILHAEGADLAAATTATVLGWPAEVIAVGSSEDANWAEFAAGLDVLVVVGPT